MINRFAQSDCRDFGFRDCFLSPAFNIQSFAVRKIKPPSAPRAAMTDKRPIQTLPIEIPSTESQIPNKFQFPNPKS